MDKRSYLKMSLSLNNQLIVKIINKLIDNETDHWLQP